MEANFVDSVTPYGFRLTEDGFLVGNVKCARTGVQTYLRSELGLDGAGTIQVYRPPEAVFSKDSLATFSGKPVTMGHPSVPVTAENWGDLAVGQVGEEIARDGETVRVSIAIMDGPAVKGVQDGTRQVSMGYRSPMELRDGVTPQGEPFQAVQTGPIRINHLAVVKKARGGDQLQIELGDADPWGASPVVQDQEAPGPIVRDYNSSQARDKNGMRSKGGGGGGSSSSKSKSSGGSSSGGAKREKGADGFYTPKGETPSPSKRTNVAKPTFSIKEVNSMFSENHGPGSGEKAVKLTSTSNLQAVSREHTIINPFTRHGVKAARKELKARGVKPEIIKDTKENGMKRIVLDGFTIEVNDQAVEAIDKLMASLADRDATIERLETESATKDVELTAKDKALEDAKAAIPTGPVLDAMVAERTKILDAAKKVDPSMKLDGKSNAEIKRAIVNSVVGDAAMKAKLDGKSEVYADAFIDAHFDHIVADKASVESLATSLQGRSYSDARGSKDTEEEEEEAYKNSVKRFERKKKD